MMQDPNGSHRSYAPIAWLIILAVCGLKVSSVVKNTLFATETDETGTGPVMTINEELMGKVVVGGTLLAPESGEIFLEQIATLRDGGWGQRLAYTILYAEVEGPEVALALIDDEGLLDAHGENEHPRESIVETMRLLLGDRIEGRLDLPSVGDVQREELRENVGWLGRLALLPPESSDVTGRTALIESLAIHPNVMGLVFVIIGVFGLCGLCGLNFLFVSVVQGRVGTGFRLTGSNGGIYAETFAAWILVFFGWQYVVSAMLGSGQVSNETGIALQLMGFFLSLLVLYWPVWRGVSWTHVRHDIGWTMGRGPLRELFGGLAGYAMAIPITAVGIGVMLLAIKLQESFLGPAPPPSHPAQQVAASGDVPMIILLYLIASVAAPITEETMFRGVLYRHLREATGKRSWVVSALLSAFVSSLIFAMVHPQGLTVVPTLTALAMGFCLIREWRGALPGAMIAHGFSNFLVISLNVALFGS
jgi:membrane protease YdiL (CAAX protease family)